MKKISVIIPTYNSWETLKTCITSIQNQTIKPREIIVINNGSTDGTPEKVKNKFPKIRLIDLKINTGVTGGRNAGIRQANIAFDYLFFFDHDMVAEKKMLSKLVEVAESSKEIGIVTPKIYYYGNKKRIWSAGTGINLWTGKIIFRGGEDIGQYENVAEVQVAPAAILVKRNVMKKLKLFDDTYFVSYEDTDFCFRAKEIGFKTFYAPKAIAYHILSWDPRDDVERVLSRAYWIGRNRVIFMKRYGKSFFVFLLFLPLFSLYYLFISIRCKQAKSWFRFLHGNIMGMLH